MEEIDQKDLPWNDISLPRIVIDLPELRGGFRDDGYAQAYIVVDSIQCWQEVRLPETRNWGVSITLKSGAILYTFGRARDIEQKVAEALKVY